MDLSNNKTGRGVRHPGRWLPLAALLAVMSACGGDTEEGTSVQKFMESAGQVESITVSDIYDRAVSEVVIVCPYTQPKSITDELGFDWPGAKSLANSLTANDSKQAVIAVHDGEVVELEVMRFDVLDLCDMDIRYPATLDAETTLQVGPDGRRHPLASTRTAVDD